MVHNTSGTTLSTMDFSFSGMMASRTGPGARRVQLTPVFLSS